MKKNSLLLMITLVLVTSTAKSEDSFTVLVTKPYVALVASPYNYPIYALQAGGAAYALTGIKSLLSAKTPSDKEISPKKALEERIKKANEENKVWAGISLVLLGTLGKIITDLFIGTGGMEVKIDINK